LTPVTTVSGWCRAAVLVSALLLLGAGPAHAADWNVNDLPPVDDQTLNSSIASWSADDETLNASIASWPLDDEGLNASIGSWSLDGSVGDFATTTQGGGETVVTLNADILFQFAKAALPSTSSARITKAVATAPRGSAVSVGGHTDNVGNDASNLKLSKARAQAVASAVKAARPDLVLTVKGFGEGTPVASNADAGARSKNRRVEIRFAS